MVPDVTDINQQVSGDLALNREMPRLHVRRTLILRNIADFRVQRIEEGGGREVRRKTLWRGAETGTRRRATRCAYSLRRNLIDKRVDNAGAVVGKQIFATHPVK